MRGDPVEPPFGCSSNLDDLGGKERRPDFEATMSGLTYEIANMERLKDLTPDQTHRVRQAVVRLSNLERRLSK